MYTIVIGAGEVGFDIASILSRQQHDVAVVDSDPLALRRVEERLDVLTVHGSGTSLTTLESAGVRRADMLLAVTAIDEVNVIACMMADRVGVKTTVARVRSDEMTSTQSVLRATDFGIDLLINPESSAANEVVQLIRRATATDVLTFADGRLHLVGVRLGSDSPAIGLTMAEFAAQQSAWRFRIAGIGRGIRSLLPRGGERFQKNDQVFLLAEPKVVPHITLALGRSESQIRHLMIVGGTNVGAKAAMVLSSEQKKSVKLVESDRLRASRLADQLKDVLVLHADATDVDALVAEGLAEMDAVVAVTEDEESNLVTCLLAKHLGVAKTIALLSKSAYIPISQSIGLDAAVSLKLAISREIMRFVRGKHVKSVATVLGLDAEILEIQASPRSRLTREPLRNLRIPEWMLIGAVLHPYGAEVATGTTVIDPGDQVIVFVLPQRVADGERMLGGG
jgi:trk system potassium uptake protein